MAAAPNHQQQYKIEELIGDGGMSKVYRGFDTKIGRTVAIKCIETRSNIGIGDFKIQSKLNHDNILKVFDVVMCEDEIWIITPYAEKGSLDQRLNGDPLDFDLILQVATQIKSALSAIHKAGIIHNDIKPSNILIDEHDNFLLSDFGIAEYTKKESRSLHTMGTPEYMAPEQFDPKHKTDIRSDIYAFGVVIYEMLTGKSVRGSFSGDNTNNQEEDQMPDPPSKFNPALNDRVDRVMRKVLAANPRKRYQDIASFVDDLTAALPVESGKASKIPKTRNIPALSGKPNIIPFIVIGLILIVGTILVLQKPFLSAKVPTQAVELKQTENALVLSVVSATDIPAMVSQNEIVNLSQSLPETIYLDTAVDSDGRLFVMWTERFGQNSQHLALRMSSEDAWRNPGFEINFSEDDDDMSPPHFVLDGYGSPCVLWAYPRDSKLFVDQLCNLDASSPAETRDVFDDMPPGSFSAAYDVFGKLIVPDFSNTSHRISMELFPGELLQSDLPEFFIDSNNSYYLFWRVQGDQDSIVVAVSQDEGDNWPEFIQMKTEHGSPILGYDVVRSKSNQFHVVFWNLDGIFYQSYFPEKGLGELLQIENTHQKNAIGVALAVDDLDRPHMVWVDDDGFMVAFQDIESENGFQSERLLVSDQTGNIEDLCLEVTDRGKFLFWTQVNEMMSSDTHYVVFD
jgi:serine/threonine protein kinase